MFVVVRVLNADSVIKSTLKRTLTRLDGKTYFGRISAKELSMIESKLIYANAIIVIQKNTTQGFDLRCFGEETEAYVEIDGLFFKTINQHKCQGVHLRE